MRKTCEGRGHLEKRRRRLLAVDHLPRELPFPKIMAFRRASGPSSPRTDCGMRRLALLAVVALLLGAAVNVLVAWTVVLPVRWASMQVQDEKVSGGWPEPVPPSWPATQDKMTKRSPGYVVECWMTFIPAQTRTSEAYRFDVHRSGWPLPCLVRIQYEHFVLVSRPGKQTPISNDLTGFPAPTWRTWGAPVPAFLDRVEPGWKRFPIQPLPLAFAADTALYGLALLALFGLVAWLRRLYLRRRGGCRRCGYSRVGIPPAAPCPECGLRAVRSHP